jgi:hypothetical protein
MSIMPRFVTATREQLQPILNILTNLPEVTPYQECPRIMGRLGWTMIDDASGNTNLPVSFRYFSMGGMKLPQNGKELTSTEFRVSDTFDEGNMESRQIIAEAFPGMVEIVSACLGFTPTRPLWVSPGATWDLVDEKQVNLYQSDDVIDMQVWARERAELERKMVRRGINPERSWEEAEWNNPTGTRTHI